MAPESIPEDETRPLLSKDCEQRLRNLCAQGGGEPGESFDSCLGTLDDEKYARFREHLRRTCNVPGVQDCVPRNCDKWVRDLKRTLSNPLSPTSPRSPLSDARGSSNIDLGKDDGATLNVETRQMVRVVYVLAVLTMLVMTTTNPMLLLYLQHVGFATKDNVSFYVLATVVNSAVPVVGHAALGAFAARVGTPRALTLSCSLIALGLIGMACSPPSKFAFIISFAVYSLCQSIRVVRTVLLTERVPPRQRTGVMSLHMLMTPIGALMGPLLWLACEQYNGDVHLIGGVRFNMYTLDYFLAATLAIVMAVVSTVALGRATANSTSRSPQSTSQTHGSGGNGTSDENQVVHVQLSDGTSADVNVHVYQRNIFLGFLVVMFCVNVGMGIYTIAFQPILVNVYNATGQDLGVIFFIISLIALVPPLLVAYLSRFLKDRQILFIGLLAKLVGVTLFLPIFSTQVYRWQVVAGFILIIKASIFFFTASMSLFTKLLGGMSNGTLLGVLSSFSSLGPAAAQLLFAEEALTLFGSFKYAAFGAPVVLATAIVVHPWYWKRLDPDREFTRVLLREYESINSREHHA